MSEEKARGGGVTGRFVDDFLDKVGGTDAVAERTAELFMSTSDKWDHAYSPKTASSLLKTILGAFKDRDQNVYTEIGLDMSDPEVTTALRGFAIEEIKVNPEFRLLLVAIAIDTDPNVVGSAIDASSQLLEHAIPPESVLEAVAAEPVQPDSEGR